MFDEDIPPPLGNKTGRRAKYSFSGIEVGQSRFVPLDETEHKSSNALRASLTTSAIYQNRAIVGIKFKTERRTENGKDGIRIWRVN